MSFKFTSEQLDFIRSGYKVHTLDNLTILFEEEFGLGKSVLSIRACTKNHSMKSGRTGQFEKGNKPWNEGTIGVMKGSSTSFSNGHVPANIKPIGYERICVKDGFILIKVDEINPRTGFKGRFRHKHIVVFEETYGPVPEGHVVRLIDGDKMNCEPENLMAIPRKIHLQLNRTGYKDVPEKYRHIALTIVKLEVKAYEKVRELKAS